MEDKEKDNVDQKQIIEKVSDSKEAGNVEMEQEKLRETNEFGKLNNAEEAGSLKVVTDTQTLNESNEVLVEEQRTNELDEVQKQKITGEEVTQEPEDQKQEVNDPEANKIKVEKHETVNEPYDGEKMESLHEEISITLRQDLKEDQKANESQAGDLILEQENLNINGDKKREHMKVIAGLGDKEQTLKVETFSDKSNDNIKSKQVEQQDMEESVELVEIVEEQNRTGSELKGVEEEVILDEKLNVDEGEPNVEQEKTTEEKNLKLEDMLKIEAEENTKPEQNASEIHENTKGDPDIPNVFHHNKEYDLGNNAKRADAEMEREKLRETNEFGCKLNNCEERSTRASVFRIAVSVQM